MTNVRERRPSENRMIRKAFLAEANRIQVLI